MFFFFLRTSCFRRSYEANVEDCEVVFWKLSTGHSNQVSWVRFLVTAGFSLFSLVTSFFFYYGLARHKACLLLALSISHVWWRHCQSTAACSTVLHCLKWYANDYGGRKHVHTHMHAHARTHTHACTHTHAHTRMHAHTRAHTHTRTHTRTHTHSCTCTHAHTPHY